MIKVVANYRLSLDLTGNVLDEKRPTKIEFGEKLHQYSKLCKADIYLGIRIRDTGRVFTFSADRSGFWAFLYSKLVCYKQTQDDHYVKIGRALTILSQSKNSERTLGMEDHSMLLAREELFPIFDTDISKNTASRK